MQINWNIDQAALQGWKAIKPNQKTAFFTALAVGTLAHICAITRPLFNHDYMMSFGNTGSLAQGKWLFGMVYRIDAGLYNHSLSIVTALLALALSAALVVDALEIRSRVWSACTGAVMVTFPSVMSAFSYYVGFWDVFLLVLPVWLMQKIPKWGGVLAIIPMVLGLGLYQPFISVSAAGFLIVCMMEALRDGSTVRSVLTKAFAALGVMLAGIAGYYGILQLRLQSTGTVLGDYHNADTMSQIDWLRLPALCAEAVHQVFRMMLDDAYGTGAYFIRIAYRLTLTLLVIALVFVALKRRLFRKPGRLVLYLLFAALLPLAVHLVYPLSQGANTHWIMRYPFVFLFIALFKFCDEILMIIQEQGGMLSRAKEWIAAVQQWSAALLTLFLVGVWTLYAYEGYMRLQFSFYGAYAAETRIVDDIYADPTYVPGAQVALIGLSKRSSPQDELARHGAYTGIVSQDFIFSYGQVPRKFMEMWLHPDFTFADDETIEELRKTAEFAAMPMYPQPGYVQNIDGVIVARLGE